MGTQPLPPDSAPLPQPSDRQRSIRHQLSGDVRIYIFMASLLPTAACLGALAVARLQYATNAFGSEVGVGALTTAIAVAAGVMGLPAGMIVDRFNPRRVLLLSVLGLGLANVALGLLIRTDHAPPTTLLIFAVADGALFGLAAPALPVTQAALVPVDSRGAAEILNILRLGVGGIVGTFLARLSPDPATTTIAAGIITMISIPIAIRIAAPAKFVRAPDQTVFKGSLTQLLTTLRELPRLRAAVIADLVLRFVVPTQLSVLFIVDRDVAGLTGPVLTAGLLGGLVGSLWLAHRGLSGNLQRILVWCFGVFAVSLTIGALLLATGWLEHNAAALLGLIAFASACSALGLGLLAALIQQRSPDDIRGRLSGALAAARMFLIAAGGAVATAVITKWQTYTMVWLLAAMAVVAVASLRGFRSVGSRV